MEKLTIGLNFWFDEQSSRHLCFCEFCELVARLCPKVKKKIKMSLFKQIHQMELSKAMLVDHPTVLSGKVS